MAEAISNIIFGPVPSRRLGKSIGVNNIPPKSCTYSCLYCQVGKTGHMEFERKEFYKPQLIEIAIKKKLEKIHIDDYPDYIAIVPDGEPTLDINLGELITRLKTTNIPVAIITNSSLLTLPNVQNDLMMANYISLKVDSVNPAVWKKMNKPHKALNLDSILKAIEDFSKCYTGLLVTETMLVQNANTSAHDLISLAQYLKKVRARTNYISIPTRPTAFPNADVPDTETILNAYETFQWHCLNAELLTTYEGNSFVASGNFIDDILSITSVHPMRVDAVMEMLRKTNTSINVLNQLVRENQILQVKHNGQLFFMRNFNFTDKAQ